jgi:hypothetical protein
MSAAANAVSRFRTLIRTHEDLAAQARADELKLSEEAHQEWAEKYRAGLEILTDEMTAAGEEVPQ